MLELKPPNSHKTDEVATAASAGHFLRCERLRVSDVGGQGHQSAEDQHRLQWGYLT